MDALKVLLLEAIKLVDEGKCGNITDEEMSIISGIIRGTTVMCREEAAEYLEIDLHKFYRLQNEGILPKGHKRRGYKEKVYYKRDLDEVKVLISHT